MPRDVEEAIENLKPFAAAINALDPEEQERLFNSLPEFQFVFGELIPKLLDGSMSVAEFDLWSTELVRLQEG